MASMTHSIKETQVRIPSSTPGVELSGILMTPEMDHDASLPAVLMVHGMPDSDTALPLKSIAPRAKELAERRVATLCYSCRGLGGSDGDFNTLSDADATRDIGAAYRWLRNQDNVQKDKVGVWGSSWGAYTATMSLTDIDPAALFISVPALYEEERYEVPFGSWDKEQTKEFREAFQGWNHQVFRRLSAYTHPVCTVIAEKDELVPLNCQLGYLLASERHPLSDAHVMKGCTHVIKLFPEAEKKLRILIGDWFVKTLC